MVRGDHGDMAFQLGAAITTELENGICLYFEATTCELICRKDMAALLKQTILSHLTTDLNIISTHPLHIYFAENDSLMTHFNNYTPPLKT